MYEFHNILEEISQYCIDMHNYSVYCRVVHAVTSVSNPPTEYRIHRIEYKVETEEATRTAILAACIMCFLHGAMY